jgi:hypothetical protein
MDNNITIMLIFNAWHNEINEHVLDAGLSQIVSVNLVNDSSG